VRAAFRSKARQAVENVQSVVQSRQELAQKAASKMESAVITVLNSLSLSNAGEVG
jgi:hypothetical protein